uniref:Hda102 n=1 Tax=Arundo donax TaxID=35708 RepID=A0A0A9EVN6_ARUDO
MTLALLGFSKQLLPRLLRHICLVLLFFNVGLIRWQGTV